MANKKKLSKRQLRRLHINHERKQQLDVSYSGPVFQQQRVEQGFLFGAPEAGLVISRYGKLADVEDEAGHLHRCNIRRIIPSLVAGDRVIWRLSQDVRAHGIIEAVLPRQSQFVRPDYYNGIKIVAANVDQIIIVLAVLPTFSLNILDRYLVACETMQIMPTLVFNKMDLLSVAEKKAIAETLAIYQNMGYPVLFVSQKLAEGIADLRSILSDHTTIFVGQSGVGKSSLINMLLPDLAKQADTGHLSEISGLGQHTTTAVRLYHLPDGGAIIDSPGVREFGLWHLKAKQVDQGFIEFHDYLGRCRYRDCKHVDDLGCALRDAVANGWIAVSRFENYHRILDSMTEMKSKNRRAYKQNKTEH